MKLSDLSRAMRLSSVRDNVIAEIEGIERNDVRLTIAGCSTRSGVSAEIRADLKADALKRLRATEIELRLLGVDLGEQAVMLQEGSMTFDGSVFHIGRIKL